MRKCDFNKVAKNTSGRLLLKEVSCFFTVADSLRKTLLVCGII